MGDHTETVQVDFDPLRVSYEQLLDIFWKSHKPTEGNSSRQYMKVVFYHNETQRTLAEASKAELLKELDAVIITEVLPVKTFYGAEDYHQKYLLKLNRDLTTEMSRMYPFDKDFVNSTAAARLNGYAGGYGSEAQLMKEIELLGLSSKGREALKRLVAGSSSISILQ